MVLNAGSWHEERLLIDGELVAAEAGAPYPNVNPANDLRRHVLLSDQATFVTGTDILVDGGACAALRLD